MSEEYRKRIGQRIRAIRKQRGWSQESLAAECGYASHSAIVKIESGTLNVSLDALVAIARALGVPLSTLVEEACLPESPEERRRQELLEAIDRCVVQLRAILCLEMVAPNFRLLAQDLRFLGTVLSEHPEIVPPGVSISVQALERLERSLVPDRPALCAVIQDLLALRAGLEDRGRQGDAERSSCMTKGGEP